MIILHNLQGFPMAINGSLIERVDGGPETHVMLGNGTSYVVTESMEEVVRLHRDDRAAVQALAHHLLVGEAEPPPAAAGADGTLRLVTHAAAEERGPGS